MFKKLFPALLVLFGVAFGAVSFDATSLVTLPPASWLLLAPYGLLLGALWPKSNFPLAYCTSAAVAGGLGYPIMMTLC